MEVANNSFTKLPDDVVCEILKRLPVKPLSKFKCVCRSWLSLISSRRFIKTHLMNSTKDPNFTYHRVILHSRGSFRHISARSLLSEPVIDSLDVDFSIHRSPRNLIWVVGSCDGLLCLAIDKKDLILWNPTIGVSKQLPDFGVEISCRSYFAYGFGYDKSNDDYKVVGFFNGSWDLSEVVAKVYSLKANRWKAIQGFKGRWLMDDPATFADGKLYWIANSDLEMECGWNIVFLDLSTEEYGVLEMPSYVKSGFYSRLGVSEGRLFVMCSHTNRADVWIMDDYVNGNGGWANVVTIPYVDDFLTYHYKKVLFVLENGEVMLICGSKLVVFDAKDCSFRYPEMRNLSVLFAASNYFESLVSPLGNGE
ncbi:F-box/kelch-repeat protein [Striga hermonthica]|uniref:F-box/kelch-repeat protein n=1 Tax=Striga hermonthica TaxID=68872 RepID=A0A9N7NIC6_STRHE|nr:F-box/kelch-repeat protein [Striga hermonthica]